MNKTIKVSNVEQSEGQYGPNMKIGYKPANGEWENYYCSKPELFQYFPKGATVSIEYKTKTGKTGKEYGVIEGVSPSTPQAQAQAEGGEGGKNASIEKQTIIKAWAQVKAGTEISAAELAADVNRIYDDVFGDKLKELKAKAAEALDATEEDDEGFGF